MILHPVKVYQGQLTAVKLIDILRISTLAESNEFLLAEVWLNIYILLEQSAIAQYYLKNAS